MNKLIKTITLLLTISLLSIGCAVSRSNPSDGAPVASNPIRQALEDLPEPTFQSLLTYTHDLSAKGVGLLVVKYPDARIPLRVASESALSILENRSVTMFDVITLSESLDEIKEGKVKIYLDLAWALLEYNGVIRRDDLTATLTQREQSLLVALFHGISLGTGSADERDRILNGYGPRYGPEEIVDSPPAGPAPAIK